MPVKEFEAELMKIPDMDASYICVPFNPVKEFGKKSHIKVKATIDGELYRGSLVDMGWGTMLGVTKALREKIGKKPGEIVQVSLEEDLEERIIEIPEDLKYLFKLNLQAFELFSSLSFTNRKEFINWIISAKKTETRKLRLTKTIGMLLQGKRNPSDK